MRLEEDFLVRVSGYAPRLHVFATRDGKELGRLQRTRESIVFDSKDDRFTFERGPGLVRTYFRMWDQNRQFIGSSYRWNPLRRKVVILIGNQLYNLVPRPGFGRSATLVDSRCGRALEIFPQRFLAASVEFRLNQRFELASLALVYVAYRRLALECVLPGLWLRKAERL